MSKKANPSIIGLFILGAIILIAMAILFFSATSLFTPKKTFVLYFQESVNGLEVGAPVKFKGVPIGEVAEILINFNDQHTNAYIPVVIEIDKAKLHDRMGELINLKSDNLLQNAIASGLRARLQFQSFVTGLLYIELNYFAEAPAPTYIGVDSKWRELPTIASGELSNVWKQASKLFADIGKVDFKGISDQFIGLLTDMRSSLHEFNFKDINTRIQAAASAIEHLASSEDLNGTFASTKAAMEDFSKLIVHTDARLDLLVREFGGALSKLRCTFSHFDSMLEPQSQFRYRLDTALEEFTEASKAVHNLADYLERNPQSLLKGKAPPVANKNVPR